MPFKFESPDLDLMGLKIMLMKPQMTDNMIFYTVSIFNKD